jgi:mannose/cellobiose epimerase-like protein (N-acyl-D-glucosamine 2-epimerase family)
MIVTQARHIWTLSKIAYLFDDKNLIEFAFHGFKFLMDKMWDEKYGGFYTVRSREGNLSTYNGYDDEKRTYGNAFAIYGLAALYEITKDENVLNLAKKTFNWIETLYVSKKLVDHAIENGWDESMPGFYDEGYYFDVDNKCQIIKDTKIW